MNLNAGAVLIMKRFESANLLVSVAVLDESAVVLVMG